MLARPNLYHPRSLALRLVLLALLAVALPLVLLAPGSASTFARHRSGFASSTSHTTVLTIAPQQTGPDFALGTVGLSVETEELGTHDLSAAHRPLVALMRLLGPGVLRIGGNSLDYSWWTSSDEPRPAWATSVVTPADLVNLRQLLAATGWRVILGVDLGHLDPTRAADEVRIAEPILGSRLLGFEVGNEPNDYGDPLVKLRPSSYSVSSYLRELATYRTAMRSVAPSIRFFGPDLGWLSWQKWLPAIISDKAMSFTSITQHYYPTSYNIAKGICKGTPVPSALELLSSQARERETTVLRTLVAASDAAQREARIDETNTTASCDTGGGPHTSPVFTSALWAFDWVLRSASAGITGINFHGAVGRCAPDTISPICASGTRATDRGQVRPRPEYYGLLAARQLEGGHFIPVQISRDKAIEEDLTAYATVHARGVMTVAIDNVSTTTRKLLTLNVPSYERAVGERLLAPSVDATSNVTFGNASANSGGVLQPRRARISGLHGVFQLQLPPASAIVITLYR